MVVGHAASRLVVLGSINIKLGVSQQVRANEKRASILLLLFLPRFLPRVPTLASLDNGL